MRCISFLLLLLMSMSVGCAKDDKKTVDLDSIRPLLKGNFIQPYLVQHWSEAQWHQEFKKLKEVGMEYLIFGPALLENKDGKRTTLYPSTINNVSFTYEHDLIERCLKVAQEEGIKVFVGMNFNDQYWTKYFEPTWFMNEMKEGNVVADELYSRYKKKYPQSFYGWYWVWEVDNYNSRTTESQKVLADGLALSVNHLNSLSKDMPIMLSPFMNSALGTAADYGKMWEGVFEKVNFRAQDIFVPQDCIGAGGLKLGQSALWFEELGKAVRAKSKMQFWANIENFDQRFWTSATLDRVVQQMEDVKPFVSNYICFSYSHYYSLSTKNPAFHQAYLSFVKHGELPQKNPPKSAENVYLNRVQDGLKITWKQPNTANQAVGYRYYQQGKLILDKQQVQPENLDLIPFKDLINEGKGLTLTTYNELGEESSAVEVFK